MADTNVKLTVSVETQQAEQNVDKLNKKLDQTKQKTDNVNKTAAKGASSISSWGTAFQGAFNEIDKGVSQAGGDLSKVFNLVKGAIPTIKKLNSTALSGIKGIKAALASTLIGGIIVALGLVVSHWKEIAEWTGIAGREARYYAEQIERVNNASEVRNRENRVEIALMQARGADEVEIAETKVKQAKREADLHRDDMMTLSRIANLKKKDRQEAEETWKKEQKAYDDAYIAALDDLKVAKERKKFREEEEAAAAAAAAHSKAQAKAAAEAAEAAEAYANAQKSVYGMINQLRDENKDKDFWNNLIDPNSPNLLATELLGRIVNLGKEVNSELVKDAIAGNAVILKEEEEFQEERIKRVKEGLDGYGKTEEERAIEVEGLEKELWQVRLKIAEDNYNALKQYDPGNAEALNEAKRGLDLLKEQYVTFEMELLTAEEKRWEEHAKARGEALDKENAEIKEKLRTRLQLYASVGREVASIFDSMVEAQRNQIEMDQKLGKIGEEEAKKRFQQLKGYELAANWINTLAGIANVWAAPEGKMGSVGWIIQAAQSAALLAQGIARDRQIRNSYIDNPDMGGSGNGGMAGATPLQVMSDITPSPTMNIPVSSEDTRVYILESDIQKSNNRVKVREDNTTW